MSTAFNNGSSQEAHSVTFEPLVRRQASPRCGKLTCEYYDEKNKVSKCKLYLNRNLCAVSVRQRKKHGKSQKRNNEFNQLDTEIKAVSPIRQLEGMVLLHLPQ